MPEPDPSPEARAARLPIWSAPVEPVPLKGGITNTNFVVADGGRKYVVRIGGDIEVHGISRRNELAASRAAHAAGVAPEVIYAEPGALVLSFVDGATFTPADVRKPKNAPRIVDLIRRCHRMTAEHLRGPGFMFWVFHVLRDYGHTLRESGAPDARSLDHFAARARRLERAVGPVEIAFGHNDLLAANIIDDGVRLWLVDWEYAGFNSPLFDLGGLASNSELPPTAAEHLLELYFEKPVTDELRFRFAAMTAASLLREALWSMVSEAHSTLDFDYSAYTAENLSRFEAAFAAFEVMERR